MLNTTQKKNTPEDLDWNERKQSLTRCSKQVINNGYFTFTYDRRGPTPSIGLSETPGLPHRLCLVCGLPVLALHTVASMGEGRPVTVDRRL